MDWLSIIGLVAVGGPPCLIGGWCLAELWLGMRP